MDIKRDFYLSKLINRIGNGQVKVITGVRRCGKSFLLNTLFYDYLLENDVSDDHIIKFAFDSAEDLALIGEDIVKLQKENRKADPKKFMNYIKSRCVDNGKYFLLLDEVQLMDSFESVLNGYLRKRNIDLFVTGSNAKFLSKDIITEFSGHGDEIHMYPLSFSEFMSFFQGDKYEGLSQYMTYGGIPLVVLSQDNGDKADLLAN
ncbi:MAG: AAA family ATPase, partial [Clostridiales bacterium]|nr:AAA family ATPase [Clostridiales bacterium]